MTVMLAEMFKTTMTDNVGSTGGANPKPQGGRHTVKSNKQTVKFTQKLVAKQHWLR